MWPGCNELSRFPIRLSTVVKGAAGLMTVELAEVIGQLRVELTKAMTAGAGEDLRFGLGPVELELTVAVNKEATTGAKVKFWVVEAGADGKLGSTSTQKIKLTLDPHQVSRPGARPDVSVDEMVGED